MPRKRSSELELNFDGLTDSVTNLVGALILLVVLVIGVTKEAVSQQDKAQKPRPAAQKSAGEKSARPLQDRVNQLKAQINGVDKQAGELKAELQQIRTQVDNLLEKVRKVQTPQKKTVSPKKTVVEKVPFRAGLARNSRKDPKVAFICENKRVSVLDIADFNRQIRAAIKSKSLKPGRLFRLATGDFDVKVMLAGGELVRKSGHEGESIETIRTSGATFLRLLEGANPATERLQFAVYPDSFDTFRAARKMAWDRKFDLNWIPQLAGEPIGIGGGAGVVQ